MFQLGAATKIYLAAGATDMRKSFDGLCGLVTAKLARDPLSGEVFVFVNRRRTHMKLLVWDRTGFVLYYKRLESGTFELPPTGSRLRWSELVLMLEGISIRSVRYRKRYRLPERVAA